MDSTLPPDADGFVPQPTSASGDWQQPKRRRPAPVQADCCRTCRLRKVKCTGNIGYGPCTNCLRLELACSFVDPEDHADPTISRTTPSHSHTEAGTLRKRAQRACSQCHAHKTKCSGDLPRCKRCEGGNLTCEYTPAKRKFTNVRFNSPTGLGRISLGAQDGAAATPGPEEEPNCSIVTTVTTAANSTETSSSNSPSTPHPSALKAEDALLKKDIVLRHMDAYMDYLYWLPSHGFLHPPTMYHKIHEGTIHPLHAAALCSMASLFVNPGEPGREFGLKCSQLVEMNIFQNIQMFSEDTMILITANIGFNILNISFAKVWQCFGVASRLMTGLQLNWDVTPANRSFIKQESLRRVSWQMFIIDRLLAGGYEEYVSCRSENMKLRLPCDENAFRENRPVDSERLHDSPGRNPNTGFHAYLIRLVDLRHRIQVTTKKLTNPAGFSRAALEPSKVMTEINSLQNELTRFHASVPADIRLSDQSIARYMAMEEHRGYVFFHCHLSVCHTDLYRFALPGYREPSSIEMLRKLPREFILRSQRQAVAHAMCFGRFVEAIQSEVDKQSNHGHPKLAGSHDLYHLSIQSIEVLLIALQYNLYQDLQTDTTAPLWRNEPADEAHIRGLVDSLHRVSEPWGNIFEHAKKACEASKASVAAFYEARKNAGQHGPARPSDMLTGSSNQLPGPDHILDNFYGTFDETMRRGSRARGASAPGPWLPMSPDSEKDQGLFSTNDVSMDLEFRPPGLPVFLAHAKGIPQDPAETPTMYGDNIMMIKSNADGMVPESPQYIPLTDGFISPASMGEGIGSQEPFPNDPHQLNDMQTHDAFVPPPPGLFVKTHHGAHPNGNSESGSYFHQTWG